MCAQTLETLRLPTPISIALPSSLLHCSQSWIPPVVVLQPRALGYGLSKRFIKRVVAFRVIGAKPTFTGNEAFCQDTVGTS